MPTFSRYRATFRDGTSKISIWTDRPLTHCWQWTGQDSDNNPVGGSGFAGSEALALKQIKSKTSWLTKRPGRSKYDFQERAYWKPGGILVSEEIVPALAIEVMVDGERRNL